MTRASRALLLLLFAGCAGNDAASRTCTTEEPAGTRSVITAPVTTVSPSEPSGVAVIPFDLPKAGDPGWAPPPAVPPRPGLPQASSASTQFITSVFHITILADGQILADGSAMTKPDDLLALAKNAHTRDPEVRAVIMADTKTAWGNVIHAMDLLKQAGIAKIAFAVAAP